MACLTFWKEENDWHDAMVLLHTIEPRRQWRTTEPAVQDTVMLHCLQPWSTLATTATADSAKDVHQT